jgi:hypothetical protein
VVKQRLHPTLLLLLLLLQLQQWVARVPALVYQHASVIRLGTVSSACAEVHSGFQGLHPALLFCKLETVQEQALSDDPHCEHEITCLKN